MKLKDLNINIVTAVTVLIFIISTTITLTTLHSKMGEEINRIGTGFNHVSVIMNDHEDRIKTIEQSNKEIITNLEWIKATLLEIKADIKN